MKKRSVLTFCLFLALFMFGVSNLHAEEYPGEEPEIIPKEPVNTGGGASFSGAKSDPPEIISESGKLVEINDDEEEADSRKVEVKLNVKSAELVALSEDSDFAGASFKELPDSQKLDFQLSKDSGKKTVHARVQSHDGFQLTGSDSIKLKNGFVGEGSQDDSNKRENEKDIEQKYNLPLRTPIKTRDDNGVALTVEEGDKLKRKWFKTPSHYFSFFDSWDSVLDVSKSLMSSIPTAELAFVDLGDKAVLPPGSVFKTRDDSRVYIKKKNGKKCWIKDESAYKGLGYDFDQVKDVHPSFVEKLESCSDPIDYEDKPKSDTSAEQSEEESNMCQVNSDCNDGNPATTDICNSNNKCEHKEISGACSSNIDCDDSNPTTLDKCINNQCRYQKIDNTCSTDSDCNDGDSTTIDSCNTQTNKCEYKKTPNTCNSDAECDDGDASTIDRCNLNSSPNKCEHVEDPNYCNANSDCLSQNMSSLYNATCTPNNQCKYTKKSNACVTNSDCIDYNPTTTDVCNASNQCEYL